MSWSLYRQDSSSEVTLIVVKLPEGHRSITIACLTTIQHQNPSVGTPNTKVPVVIVRSQNPEFWRCRRRELLMEEKPWKFQAGRCKERRGTQDNTAKVCKIAVMVNRILARCSYVMQRRDLFQLLKFSVTRGKRLEECWFGRFWPQNLTVKR